MRHWQPERPARPLPMDRLPFVGLLVVGGMSIGMSITIGIVGAGWLWSLIALANGTLALGWVIFRIREAGWP